MKRNRSSYTYLYRTTVVVCALLLTVLYANAQKLAELKVTVPPGGIDMIPVSVLLDPITPLPDSSLALYSGKDRISFQIEEGSQRTLHWLAKSSDKSSTQTFTLAREKHQASNNLKAGSSNGELTITASGKKLLTYVFKTVYPPAGVDTAYRRSGFIHPLYSPGGQTLTRIQPKDHYHHYGLWNPWTHTLYKGDTIDFWNIGNGKANVRFSKFISASQGDVYAGFETVHEHIVNKKGAKPEVAMNEVQSVRVYKPGNDYYIMDFTSRLSCATDAPIVLLEYRYGGFGWRTTEQWDNKNSEVITSEGKNRKESDGSKARWCIVQGSVDNTYAGAVMMSYPGNYNHPEPLRIWPENQYNRGDMFANFSPTKDKDWPLTPGNDYVLRYRMLVFNNKMTKERAEAAWKLYAQPPLVQVKLLTK